MCFKAKPTNLGNQLALLTEDSLLTRLNNHHLAAPVHLNQAVRSQTDIKDDSSDLCYHQNLSSANHAVRSVTLLEVLVLQETLPHLIPDAPVGHGPQPDEDPHLQALRLDPHLHPAGRGGGLQHGNESHHAKQGNRKG